MHKSGFINIIGNPNVGKSTLVNKLVGEQLSIITSKAELQPLKYPTLGKIHSYNLPNLFFVVLLNKL